MLKKGDVVLERYRVESVCSNDGGMGTVLFVTDLQDAAAGQLVLKYCKLTEPEANKRFRREVRLLGEFAGNERVAQIIAQDLDHDPPLYVMKYYPDGDLTKLTDLRTDHALQENIFCQMIDCIQELHDRNQFHRDIKPENFLLNSGKVIVSDFGLSTELGSQTKFTSTRASWGTQGYLPPEFDTDGGFKNANATSDIFQIGKSFYALLTGSSPLYVMPGKVPEPLYHVIERCCSVRQSSRYPDLASLKQNLVAVYDVLLHRVGGADRAKQMLEKINARLVNNQYSAVEVDEFLEALFAIPDEEDLVKVLTEIPSRFYQIVRMGEFAGTVSAFLDAYRKLVEGEAYSWSYAETIASNMDFLFRAPTVPTPSRVTALDLAIHAAKSQNRFRAMDTCTAMIKWVTDETVGLAIQDTLRKWGDSFVKNIEPSECSSAAVRAVLREIRGETAAP